jgi:hypothetical protein
MAPISISLAARSSLVGLVALAASACGGKTADPAPVDGSKSIIAPPRSADAPRDPGASGPALPSGPETIASDIGEPSALALDGERVVFATRRTIVEGELARAGAVFVRDKRVGAPLMIALDREGGAYETLATDGMSAFVATDDARIVRVPLQGGDAELVADLGEPATALATAGDDVYFAGESGAVGRVLKAGGTPEALGSVPGAARGLTADDASVYVASAQGGITRITIATKAASALAPGAGEPCAMVRDGSRLFWTATSAGGTGAVLRLPLAGGDVATVASGAFAACAIAADETSLYFATSKPGTAPGEMSVKSLGGAPGLGLMRAPMGGGDPVTIAGATGALAQPGSVAVDASHVYWLTSSAVVRLRK